MHRETELIANGSNRWNGPGSFPLDRPDENPVGIQLYCILTLAADFSIHQWDKAFRLYTLGDAICFFFFNLFIWMDISHLL